MSFGINGQMAMILPFIGCPGDIYTQCAKTHTIQYSTISGFYWIGWVLRFLTGSRWTMSMSLGLLRLSMIGGQCPKIRKSTGDLNHEQ